jgi:hypothetical protein
MQDCAARGDTFVGTGSNPPNTIVPNNLVFCFPSFYLSELYQLALVYPEPSKIMLFRQDLQVRVMFLTRKSNKSLGPSSQ